MPKTVGKSVIVKGLVQEVFYRASTRNEAVKLGLTGWVKNLANGDVQFEVFGEEATVNQLIDWSKTGPRLCRVDQVVVSDIPLQERNSFEIRF